MKDNVQLPEEYTRVEYIEYRPKQEQLFAFGQFERFKEAFEFAKHINASMGNDICKITTFQSFENVLFCVVFPESVFEKVDCVKKENCTIYKTSINVEYNIPFLYRFIKEEYVDSFFETGELKLTTFENCKTLEDKNRKDTMEGQSKLYGYDGNIKIQFDSGVGSNAIMLCTSLCSEYEDDNGFAYTKYIEIFNVQGLLFAIAEQLSKKKYIIKEVLFGPCFYAEKEFHKAVNSGPLREKLDTGHFDGDEMTKMTNTIGGKNMFFQKPIDKRMENEFRLLWIVDNIKNGMDIFVKIPHPEAYCRLIVKKK